MTDKDTDEDVLEREQGDDNAGAADAAIEERARRIGWSPKDEFRGDPEKWMPAKEYVDRGEQILPIMVERNRRLDDRLSKSERNEKALRDQVTEISGKLDEAVTTFREFRTATSNVEQRAYDRAKAELEAEQRQAVIDADPAKYDKAKQQLDDLEKTAPKPPPTEQRREPDRREEERREPERRVEARNDQVEISETAKIWVEGNPWFLSDKKAGRLATVLHGTNLADGMSEADSLADVRTQMETVRPDLFENPRRRAPASVESPSGNPPRRRANGGRTFDDLPADAKSAYQRFHKQDPKFTKEDYLRDYMWE